MFDYDKGSLKARPWIQSYRRSRCTWSCWCFTIWFGEIIVSFKISFHHLRLLNQTLTNLEMTGNPITISAAKYLSQTLRDKLVKHHFILYVSSIIIFVFTIQITYHTSTSQLNETRWWMDRICGWYFTKEHSEAFFLICVLVFFNIEFWHRHP